MNPPAMYLLTNSDGKVVARMRPVPTGIELVDAIPQIASAVSAAVEKMSSAALTVLATEEEPGPYGVIRVLLREVVSPADRRWPAALGNYLKTAPGLAEYSLLAYPGKSP